MCPIHTDQNDESDEDPWGEIIGEIKSAAGLGYVLKKDDASMLTLHSDLREPGIIISVLNIPDAQVAADSMDPQAPTPEEISDADKSLFQWPIDETIKEQTLGELLLPGWSGVIVKCPCGNTEMQCHGSSIEITCRGYIIWEYRYSRYNAFKLPLIWFMCRCLH
jgi:hypothetical protein